MECDVLITRDHPLLLASQSPRRRHLLTQIALPHCVTSVEVDEALKPSEAPRAYLERIVAAKSDAARMKCATLAGGERHRVVLVADTIVVHGGQVLGKPQSRTDARRILARLRGQTHQVMTRYAASAVHPEDAALPLRRCEETVATEVVFGDFADAIISAYVATGESDDKAGAYGIQGRGAVLVSEIRGDYNNVVGLPVRALAQALQSAGWWQPFSD